jgi:hypothetical protein
MVLSARLLGKIEDAVKKRKGIERDSESPSPTSACGRISGWLCTTATDIRRVAKDSEEVEGLQRELQEVVQEFNVSGFMVWARPRDSFLIPGELNS